jgi:hypothetical protein
VQEFILTLLSTVVTAIITWFLAKRKNSAEAKIAEIEAEIKAADFYKTLVDDAMLRLDKAVATINSQDEKIKHLTLEIERLLEELKKYKQLNGKV